MEAEVRMQTDVTVRQIMEIPLFKENGTLFSGQQGLERSVQFVTVMETPDFNVRTLHKATMVLTTLSAYYHRLAYVNMIVESLCKHGIAAIVIKLGRYLDELDSTTIAITQRYDTALITIPNTVMFSRAISDVLSIVNQSQQSFISGLNDLTGSLISSILQNKETSTILRELTQRISCCCAVHSGTGDLIYQVSSCQLQYEEKDTLDLIDRSKTDDFGYLRSGGHLRKGNTYLFGCFAHGIVLGYLTIVLANEMDGQTLAYVHQLVSFLSIKFLERHLQTETEQRMVLPIIDKLLLGVVRDEGKARDRMSILGVVPKDKHIVILLSPRSVPDNFVPQYSQLEYWKSLFHKVLVNCNLFLKGNDYLVLASFRQESRFCNTSMIRSALGEVLPLDDSDMVLGLGSMCTSFSGLPECYKQAKMALRFSKIFCPNDIFCHSTGETEENGDGQRIYIYDDYTEIGMLSHVLKTSEYQTFYQSITKPILEYNTGRDSDLWATLETCVEAKSLEKAAKDLFIHISTLRYRLQKIFELTGVDFFTPYGRFLLTLAVRLQLSGQSE